MGGKGSALVTPSSDICKPWLADANADQKDSLPMRLFGLRRTLRNPVWRIPQPGREMMLLMWWLDYSAKSPTWKKE